MRTYFAELRRCLTLAAAIVALAGCGDRVAEDNPHDPLGLSGGDLHADGKPGLGSTGYEDPQGKADALVGRRGLPVSVDDEPTQVWEVENDWADRNTVAARASGIAWEADSGLSWEEKYQRWVASFEKIEGYSGYGETFRMPTPWGRTMPAPSLECAEAAIFLRVTFASWYKLPFFMEAIDRNGDRVFFGHFGIRTAEGSYGRMPDFETRYDDHSELADAIRAGTEAWPRDAKLASLSIPGSFDDEQPMIGEGAHAGAYFDRVWLNKRVGYFMRLLLTYFGSINLADSVNTYNVAAEDFQPGDALVERWQRSGIGHVLIVVRRQELGTQEVDGATEPLLEAELASGSMPRRQPRWESAAASKRYFTLAETGGPDYVEYKGGLKRFRAARNEGGRWTNVVLDEDSFINSRHTEELSERPARFETILSELGPEEKLETLLDIVEQKRQHLRRYPASCAARIAREDAFDDIYELAADELGLEPGEVDRRYRKFEDYVFAELVYDRSKTCCWNSSTAEMYEIVMDYNRVRFRDEEAQMCQAPVVFMNRDDDSDGYELFRAYAESTDRGAQWVDWSADESCSQADVPVDTEAEHAWVPACTIADDLEVDSAGM